MKGCSAGWRRSKIIAPSGSGIARSFWAKIPDYFKAALGKNAKAGKTFENFSPSEQKEYTQWLTEAKRDETRQQRLNTSIAWLAQGKPRNWKYMPGWNKKVRSET